MTIKGIIYLFVFGIAFPILSIVEGSPAQTIVCSGNTVVLVLNGYKQGSTLWQQSTDGTGWSSAQGNSYNDSLVIVATNTSYYYRAIVTDSTCNSPFYSDMELVIIDPPSPTSLAASGITSTSFVAKWNAVGSPGDTAYYTYYLDVSPVPTFASFITGYNNRLMTDTIWSLSPVSCNTIYYYRVRAHNGHCGTSGNSNTITVTTDTCPLSVYCTYKSACSSNITDTRDNQTYKTVQIGTQCWMAQNLNVGKLIDSIISQTPGLDNQDTSIEKYCYNDDINNCTTYGGLYQWDEMMAYGPSVTDGKGPQGICPMGWHIPTENEWRCLEQTLGGNSTAGNKLKTKGNGVPPLWKSPSAGTDTSGFSALPSGHRSSRVSFLSPGTAAYFWTATATTASANYRNLNYYDAQVLGGNSYRAQNGFSARCLKD